MKNIENEVKSPSPLKLIIRGYFWVSIPMTAIILAVWYGLWKVFDMNYVICVFIGTLAGSYFWAYSIKKWIKWAYLKGISKDRILKIGRLSLLLWSKSVLDNALTNE